MPASGTSTPLHRKAAVGQAAKAAAGASKQGGTTVSQLRNEIESLGIHGGGTSSKAASSAGSVSSAVQSAVSTPMGIAHERIIEEYRKREREGKAELSLVVVGKHHSLLPSHKLSSSQLPRCSKLIDSLS